MYFYPYLIYLKMAVDYHIFGYDYLLFRKHTVTIQQQNHKEHAVCGKSSLFKAGREATRVVLTTVCFGVFGGWLVRSMVKLAKSQRDTLRER